MATAKTGSFYLTETVQIPTATAAGGRVQGEIDLGAYVNVPTGQAVAVESVDFVYQVGSGFSQAANFFLQANGCVSAQLSDLNPGTAFVRADDQSLIASGAMNLDTVNAISSNEVDLYPDNFGPAALSEAFLVVNDTLYLVGGNNGSATSLTDIIYVTVRIKCRVCRLSTKDWMAIAIQSTASDN